MIKKFWPFILFLFGLSLVLLYQYQKYRVAPKANLNTLAFTDTTGKPIKLAAFKNKKIILLFFGTWCGDCLLEMKQLNESMQTNFKDVQVIAVSDEPIEKIKHFADRKKYPFTFLKLSQLFANIDIYAIPVTYIINPEGEITNSKVGAINWKDPSTVSFIEEKLK